MSKGLKALKYLKENKRRHWLEGDKSSECLNCIEKELKELEERREMMKRFNEACVPMILDNETEKKLKAFEIIKIKKVDMARLSDAIKRCDLSYYNYHCYETLTQEEWDLLKEVLINEGSN